MKDDALDTAPTPTAASGTPAPPHAAADVAASPVAMNGAAVSDDLARLTDEIVSAIRQLSGQEYVNAYHPAAA